MKRREALKGIGLSLGYAIAAPSLVNLLYSCKADSNLWKPEFFSLDEGHLVKNIIDLILPKTKSSPGALEVNIPEFSDKFALNVFNEDKKEKFRSGLSVIIESLMQSERKLIHVKPEQYVAFLNKYFRSSPEELEAYKKDEHQTKVLETLVQIRNTAVWAFKTNEQIGEKVLAYDPIPTDYFCGDLDELTNGKAWSLS